MNNLNKNLIAGSLIFLLPHLLHSMDYTQETLFPHLASLPDTPNKITLHSDTINLCKPSIFSFAKDYDFANIAHLDLHVNGPFSLHYALKAPTFSLKVNGLLTLGKSNEEMGIIAATHGPLTVNAHAIDGRYGKFYGKGPTLIESTIGDIAIGALMRGVDKNLEEQWGKGSSHYSRHFQAENNLNKLMQLLGAGAYRKLVNLGFDSTLNTRNGAYIASGSPLTIKSATNVLLQYGSIMSSDDIEVTAAHEIQNRAGEISSHKNISLIARVYNHIRDGVVNKLRQLGYDYAQYFGSQPATLAALHNIHIMVSDKVYNLAGSIRSGENININKSPFVAGKHPQYIEEPQKFYIHGNYTAGYGCEETYTQPCTTQSGSDITMNLGNFTITGNMNASTIAVKGNIGSFINTDPLRNTIISTEPTFVNVTEYAQQEAQKPGFYKVSADGSIQTEFPLGAPSRIDPNHMIVLENNQPTPQLWQNIFNPLSSINLDLFLQRLISAHTGKIYKTQGQNISSVLWENALQWQQQNQKAIMSPEDIEHINESMLLTQIVSTPEDQLQQHTLLCIAPQDINPYQSPGDIVTDTFSCITQNNQTHLNNRIVGNQGIILESTAGSINLETQSYTIATTSQNSTTTEQKAMPQQQLIAPVGDITVHADHDISRVGTVMAAGTNIVERSDHGSITKKPLILQKTVETHHTKKGFFSSSHTVEKNITHSAMPCETHAGILLHDKATHALTMTASRDSAQQTIIYDAPHITIEGLLLANSVTSSEEKNGMFTDETRKSSRQTPFAISSHIKAPIVRFLAEDARVNANIYATELHDETDKGIQFVAKIAQMLCSGQTIISSPLASVDSGFEAGYETMIPPMLMVEKIIRLKNNGCMLFESAIMDKNYTQVIGKFVETTYHLKQWQKNWHHSSQLIPDEALVVIALAITWYTQGMGVELLQPLLSNITAATGMQLSAAGIAAVNAGLSAIYSSTATSFLKTGDPIHTAKHLISPAHLQSLSFTMASAGLSTQLASTLNINMEPGFKTFSEHLQQQTLQATVDNLLTTAFMNTPANKSFTKMAKQIPLKAVAAYSSNLLCTAYANHILQQIGQTLIGGLSGFAQEQTRKGFVSGMTGALTAETVGALLIADSQAIARSAIARLNKKGIEKTPANIQRAIAQEVQEKMKLAKIVAASIAALTHQNPMIAAGAATNAIDNNIAIRGQLAALAGYQKMVKPAHHTFTMSNTYQEIFEADYQKLQKAAQDDEDALEVFNLPDGKKPFVKNPNFGLWFGACISDDLFLAKGSIKIMYLFNRMLWQKHPKCPFTIFAHGDATSVVLENKNIHPEGLAPYKMLELQEEGRVSLNAYELAKLIRTAPGYKENQHIHLFSCHGGIEDRGIAQKLADEMKVPVSAFTGYAGMRFGSFTSVESDDWIPTLKTIKTFYPTIPTEISDRLQEDSPFLHDYFIH